MSWEIFEDFGKKPLYDDFLRKSYELRHAGWEDRTFLALVDAETGIHRYFPYYLMKNGEIIVYEEISGQLEKVILDERGHLLGYELPPRPDEGPLATDEEQPPQIRAQE